MTIRDPPCASDGSAEPDPAEAVNPEQRIVEALADAEEPLSQSQIR